MMKKDDKPAIYFDYKIHSGQNLDFFYQLKYVYVCTRVYVQHICVRAYMHASGIRACMCVFLCVSFSTEKIIT